MAEGFVLNIPKEMLDRLQKADEKIEKLDKNSRRVGENIRLAFMEGAKGVDKFIGSLNAAQIALDKFKDRKINVGLNLDAKAIDDLKKQLSTADVNIPVGVTGTGGGNAGESQSLKNLLDGIVILTKSVENLTQKIDGIKVTGSDSASGSGTSSGEKTDKGIGSYKSKINELLQIEKLIHDIDKAQTELAKKGDKSLSGKSLSTISNLRQQADKLLEELTKIEEKTNKDLSGIQTKWHAKELAEEQKQSKANINIQEKEANDLIKIEEREVKEYERLMGKMLKLRKDINANTDLTYSPNPKVSQDALAQITKQEALLKQFEARAKTLEGKYGAGLSEIQLKYSQKELEMLNKAVNNPASNSGIDQKTKDLREYEKVLKRISDLEKVRDRASKAISKYGANSQIGQQANALYQQAERLLQQHNQRRIALEQQYGAELDSIKQAQNAKDLNYLIQQKDAELRVTEQAEKKAIQQYTKLANERNRLLTEQYKTEKIANDPKVDSATRQLANQQLQQITAELQRNKQEMLNIELQYQGKLATIQQRAGQQELQRVRRQNQQEIDEVRRAEQRRQDIQRRWDERRYSRPQGALQYSQNAKTINEQIKALNYLRTAQKSLDVSTSQGKKQFYELEREIKKTENALRRYGVQLGGVREQSSHLFNISQQLGRALSLMFSVSQIGQYISKMVNVRKEMELQQRSLQVLLQSKDKANELWNQTLDLAVKSPFRVKELVTYTKQLAAYRIESDKLFETNKMLADVSAGLGVDMQRLILAFGQVKSASFLRGCLGKGTPIRLYNDDIKEVQDIVVGDVIMGDDNTPRNVKEVIYGKEQMYIVRQGVYGDDYRVNENHILTLKDKITDTIVDVYVKDYLKDKERYNGVKISADGNIIDYPIELIKDNIDEYFGFVIDGNKRFLLGDGTITHNTELRQFTEAGIPMLEELSKYFEELYGRSVSVAEVFDMISKRMVTFTDVENVFQRMTSAGGVFFNMQEELSQTTAGMISNLQDSIDLMFNEIGKKNQGIINTAIKWARGLVNNWETIGAVMKTSLAIFASYKALTIDWGKALDGVLLKITNIGTNITSNLKGNLIAGSIMIVIGALLAAWGAIAKYRAGINEAIDAHAKFADSVNELSIDFNRLEIDKKSEDIEEYKDKLSQLVGIAQQQYSIEIDFVVNDLQSIDEVKRKFNELKEQIMSFNNFSLAFDIEFAKQERIGRGDGLGRGISKDIEKLSNAQKDLVPYFTKVNKVLKPMLDNLNKLTDAEKKFVDAFRKQKETQSSGDYFNQQLEGLKLLNEEYDKFFEEEWNKKTINDDWYDVDRKARARIRERYNLEYNDIKDALEDYETALGKVAKEQENLFTSILGNLETEIAFAREKAFGEKGSFSLDDQKNVVESYISNVINAKATAEEWAEEIKYEWQKAANKYFGKTYKGFNIIPTIEPIQEKDLEQWQKDLQAKLEKNKDLLQGSIPMVTFQTTQEKALKDAEDAWKSTESLIKRIENAQKQSDNELKSWYSQYNVDELKKKMQVEKDIWTELGGSEDKENASEKRIKEQIRLIKELYQEYQKLSKEYGSSNAKGIVTKSFETLLKDVGLDINNIDFTNLQGIINSLTMLRGQAATAGKEASQELEKAIGETSVELGLILKVKEREDTAKEIENMFSDYEMTIDLKKLDIPQNLAEDLFDVNWTDLGDIKQRLEKERQALEKENEVIQEQISKAYKSQVDKDTIESLKLQAEGNKARLEDIDKFYQKWNEAERKSTEERLKTYTKYLLNEQHERVKIRLETLRKLQEVEATSKYTDAQKETITNKLKEEEKESLAKQTWKDFETSPMYMQMFDDIENMSKGALEQMIVTMGGLKTELQSMGLPASDLKEILSQINKVEEELERRNPFKDFSKNANIALNRSKELAKLEEQRLEQQTIYDTSKEQYDKYQDKLASAQDNLNNTSFDESSIEYQTLSRLVDYLTKETNKWAKEVEKAESNLTETNNQINNINDSSKDFYEQLKDIGSITKSVVDGVFQITDAMSWLPEETQLSLERMKGLSDSAFTIAGGIGSIMSGDIIGGVTSLISGVSGLVSLFMEWSSGAKEAAIQTEKQGRLLTELQNKYDRLNKAIDEAWNVAQIKQYNAELQKNLQLQIIAQKAIIEAQKSVKGANDYGSEQWSAVKEAEEELQNLYDTQEELQKNIYSKLTAGIMDDVLSTTESFVDAWYDAFKETGDGLKGLEDSFNEMLLNLVKRQAAMKIAGRFIDEWDKALERYASDGDLSNSEIEYYANKVKNDLPALSSQLEAFFSSFDNVLGDASGNLSGLQRGVTQIQESTAQELASYLNSIRYIVSDSNVQLKTLVAHSVENNNSTENPMISQLKIIAQQTSAINTLLNSLTAPYQGGAGRAFKVVI